MQLESISHIPQPNFIDPRYRKNAAVLDWFNDHQKWYAYRYSEYNREEMSRYRTLAEIINNSNVVMSYRTIEIKKQGQQEMPAPYVGRPFVYRWEWAQDTDGRILTGDSFICYTTLFGGF